MERQGNSLQYVNETIEMKADFIQLFGGTSVDPAHTKLLRARRMRVNFCFANVSGAFSGYPTDRIVAQACPIAPMTRAKWTDNGTES